MRTLDRPIAERAAATCRALNLSLRTAETYGHRLVHFEDWLGRPAMEATQAEAAAWLSARPAAQMRRMTTYHDRCSLAFLFRRMRGEEVDPRVLLRVRNLPAQVHRVADPEEVSRLFAAMRDGPARRICQLVYGCGLRMGEALQARLGDIDAAQACLVVRFGKGGRMRRTIMPQRLRQLVAGWCRGWPPTARIVTADGRPDGALVAQDRVRASLAVARGLAGIGAYLTVHRLRHAFATHLHERGVGVAELRLLLGHASLGTTLLYLGMRDERRCDIARVGDLLAALPAVVPAQERIAFG